MVRKELTQWNRSICGTLMIGIQAVILNSKFWTFGDTYVTENLRPTWSRAKSGGATKRRPIKLLSSSPHSGTSHWITNTQVPTPKSRMERILLIYTFWSLLWLRARPPWFFAIVTLWLFLVSCDEKTGKAQQLNVCTRRWVIRNIYSTHLTSKRS